MLNINELTCPAVGEARKNIQERVTEIYTTFSGKIPQFKYWADKYGWKDFCNNILWF